MSKLLHALQHQGFTVTTDGDTVSISPGSKLTDAMRQEIKAHKRELIRQLQAANDLPLLTDQERARIARLFLYLGETHPEILAEHWQAIERDLKARDDYLRWSDAPEHYFRPPDF